MEAKYVGQSRQDAKTVGLVYILCTQSLADLFSNQDPGLHTSKLSALIDFRTIFYPSLVFCLEKVGLKQNTEMATVNKIFT